MSDLILTFKPDPLDDGVLLRVTVDTPDFSGKGAFWVQPEAIEQFAASPETYPGSPR